MEDENDPILTYTAAPIQSTSKNGVSIVEQCSVRTKSIQIEDIYWIEIAQSIFGFFGSLSM